MLGSFFLFCTQKDNESVCLLPATIRIGQSRQHRRRGARRHENRAARIAAPAQPDARTNTATASSVRVCAAIVRLRTLVSCLCPSPPPQGQAHLPQSLPRQHYD